MPLSSSKSKVTSPRTLILSFDTTASEVKSSRALKSKRPSQVSSEQSALSFSVEEFGYSLSGWYRANARDLPWRGVKDPYAIWVSEIMLQQTRVATVMLRYTEFMQRFPTLQALAAADDSDVLALWSGLGYYRRARMLHHGAQFVVRELQARLPNTSALLRTLPGIGDYTSAAIASIAFGEPVAVVDGNVERVLLRLLGAGEELARARRAHLTAVAQSLMPANAEVVTPRPARSRRKFRTLSPGDHNQAMMELGATVCLPKAPLCVCCPVRQFCITRGAHATLPRARSLSRLTAHLLAVRKRGVGTEILLQRRSAEASQMPAMLELPVLPQETTMHREPVLRLRHSITNTNYYVQVYAEGAPGAVPALRAEQDSALVDYESGSENREFLTNSAVADPQDELFVVDAESSPSTSPLVSVVASESTEWHSTSRLNQLPLTGLARKVLQRLGVMALPPVRVR